MSPRSRKTRRRASRGLLRCWWPLIAALAVTPLALRAASLLALSGPLPLRLLFPFVTFTQTHWTAALAPGQRDALAQWAMWAQFPLYGLLASLVTCVAKVSRALLTVIAVHVAAIVAALVLR